MQDAEAVRRFSREAQAVAMLNGEHVARILDVGKLDDGRPFMGMEFLAGQDLGAILEQRHRLPLGEAIDYVIQACEALGEAHRAGVVHRDLKPANLFVVDAGARKIVKLVDFGISRFVKPDEVRVTQTQTAFGTPLYMAPESVRSAKLADARSDIWALGVILYELLAGLPPFLGDTPTSVAVSITIDKQKPLSQERNDVPAELDAIIGWALEKAPDKRPQSALAFADALRPFREAAPHSAMQRASFPGALPAGDPGATTARSMTPGLARSDQTMRTGDPLSSDVRRENKSRAALFVALGVAAFAATLSVAALIRSNTRGATADAATTAEPDAAGRSAGDAPDVAPKASEAPVQPATGEPAPSTSAAVASAVVTSTASAAAAPSGKAKPDAPKAGSTAKAEGTAPQEPTGKPPPKKKTGAPEAPGGNPLIL
jgi:serine/threonine protein kinase